MRRPDSALFVRTGEVVVAAAPCSLVTVLGSCVSVCLWSEAKRLGGLNHYLLPLAAQNSPAFLGGDRAIAALIEHMLKNGCPASSLVAKVFGGSQSYLSAWNTGAENVLVAWQELRKAGIPIVNADVGGASGRQLRFDVATGQVLIRRLQNMPLQGVNK